MGMSVVGFSLLGVAIVIALAVWGAGRRPAQLSGFVLPLLSGFSLGASSIALFMRVGGGIFTKAADIGADLVGKLEAGIPEDDPRNPATIADNVGDNVGDVAGMGADLFESYVGSLVGLHDPGRRRGRPGSAAPAAHRAAPAPVRDRGARLDRRAPSWCAAGRAARRSGRSTPAPSPPPCSPPLLACPVTRLLLGDGRLERGGSAPRRIFFAFLTGLAAGVLIGLITEYFTGSGAGPVRAIVRASETGAATTIITGLGVGMLSSMPAVLVVAAGAPGQLRPGGAVRGGHRRAGHAQHPGHPARRGRLRAHRRQRRGHRRDGRAAPEVRQITDSLDAVGNTTAAIGKGFAIGSAALTAIILFTAFKEQAGARIIDSPTSACWPGCSSARASPTSSPPWPSGPSAGPPSP